MAKDYYNILGIGKNASEDDIKKAYRKLAHQYHPDKTGGDDKKFKEINEAYQILSDKNRRMQYDRFGTAEPFGPGSGSGAGGGGFPGGGFNGNVQWGNFDPSQFAGADMGDLGDMMESIFEGFGVGPRRKTYEKGADLELQEQITLEEAFRGIVKNIKLRTLVQCEKCKGKGAEPGAKGESAFEKCTTCDGRGEIREEKRSFFGSFSQVRTCSKCHGTGEIPKKACSVCKGSGRVESDRTIRLEILPGIEDNQLIQIRGAGEAGERGTAAGDLYVRVRVKPHSVFERHGANLIVSRDLNVVDLLLGRKIEVPTISGGQLSVEIPAGFNLKENFRIVGEGMPHFNTSSMFGSPRGDLYVNFVIKAPKKLDGKARKVLEEEGE
jgi:molecular chaperone DnaJ